jgi:NAD(P)-dependent dehydrogenase (short-subunit alcohol dehydrogenase family)
MASQPFLKDQTALITGASRGIGKACVLALGAAGASVAVNYIEKPEEARAVADEVAAQGSAKVPRCNILADIKKNAPEFPGAFFIDFYLRVFPSWEPLLDRPDSAIQLF